MIVSHFLQSEAAWFRVYRIEIKQNAANKEKRMFDNKITTLKYKNNLRSKEYKIKRK